MLLSTLLLLSSCSEDAIFDDKGGNLGAASDNICFGISDRDGWPETRSATRGGYAEETVADNFVLRSADNADTLCVQTTVSDFGRLPFSGNVPVSRAALVTDGSMHESFGVTACIYTGTDKAYYFFNEKNIKPADYTSSAIWTYESGKIYYWPGANHKMQFYAYSPYECAGLTTPKNTTPGVAPTFSYIVPADAAEQTDILAYSTSQMAGDTKASVPLKFDHICTAVQFVVGKEMQPGSKSITLKGVKNAGSYAFESKSWTLGATTSDFVHNVNKSVNASAPHDTSKESITDDTDCFVMLPQTLPDGASVEIVFHDSTTGKDRTLTASLAGQEWPQGKRVKYNISISPDYILEFNEDETPSVADAHYVKVPIHIISDVEGGWTLSSDNNQVTFLNVSGLTNLHKEGYWLSNKRGTTSINGTGNQIVYAFIDEWLGNENRNITLSLNPRDTKISSAKKDFRLTQLCPAWNGNVGLERMEQGEFQWGYDWGDDYNVSYKFTGIGFRAGIYRWLIFDSNFFKWLFGIPSAPSYMHKGSGNTVLTFKFSSIVFDGAMDDSNGNQNTKELYEGQALNASAAIESFLKNAGATRNPVESPANNINDYAARMAVMHCNSYRLETQSYEGENIEVAVLEKSNWNDIWYMPAKDQWQNLSDPNPSYALKGSYWTSTNASSDDKKAYSYDSNGKTLNSVSRTEMHKVRACRNRP